MRTARRLVEAGLYTAGYTLGTVLDVADVTAARILRRVWR